MHNPRLNGNTGDFSNNLNNQRNVRNSSHPYFHPEALAALDLPRALLGNPSFHTPPPNAFRNTAGLFNGGIGSVMPSRGIGGNIPGVSVPVQSPIGVTQPFGTAPNLWNPMLNINPRNNNPMLSASRPQQTWAPRNRIPAPVMLPQQQRISQDQPLDLTKKTSPALPQTIVDNSSTSVSEAPLDFSTKSRNRASTPSSSLVNRSSANAVSKSRNLYDPSSQLKTVTTKETVENLSNNATEIKTRVEPEIQTKIKSDDNTVPDLTPAVKTEPTAEVNNSVIRPPVPCHSDTSPSRLLPAVTNPFPWYSYIQESRTQVVPEEAFPHISDMLMPIIQVNSVFDFVHTNNWYWPCLVCAVSRSTIQIRYIGAEPGYKHPGGRLWVDAGDSRMKPRGFGQKNKMSMRLPPSYELLEGVIPKDVVAMTLDLQPLSNVLIQHHATCCADLFAPGRLLEIQDPCDARVYWFARVVRNHCGRLCLHYVTAPEHDNAPVIASSPQFRASNPQPGPIYLFSSNRRLKPVGWARDHDCVYKAPAGIRIVGSPFVISRSVLDCTQLRVNPLAFQPHMYENLKRNSFQAGDRVDWLHPSRKFFCSATVRRVIDSEHFVVSSFNGNDQSTGYVTTLSQGDCFPAGFATQHLLAFRNDSGQLTQTRLRNAADEKFDFFAPGRKLEIVMPNSPELITVATVRHVVKDAVIVVEVDADKSQQYLFPISSSELFPVGFAEMSKHAMTLIPSPSQPNNKKVALVAPEVSESSSKKLSSLAKFSQNGESSRERRPFNVISSPPRDNLASAASEEASVMFSQKCFCGKLFSKSKVALLPSKIGPGDVLSVVKEALSYLLNTAYQPPKVLKILHVKTAKFCKRDSSGYSAQQLKTRSGSKVYKATTVLCTNRSNLPGYLRKIAHALNFCPGMLYPAFDNGSKLPERPHCTAMCGKSQQKPTTRRAAAAAAASAANPTADSPAKMLTVVVQPESSKQRNGPQQNHGQADSSGALSSAATSSEGRSPDNSASMETLVGSLQLSTNPLRWCVDDVGKFMQLHDCADVAQSLADQEIDGPSLLLLNLAVIQDHLSLPTGSTLKLCRLLERLHIAFRQQLDLAREYFLTSSPSQLLDVDMLETTTNGRSEEIVQHG